MKEVLIMAILIATIAATQEEIDLSKYPVERSISSCEMTSPIEFLETYVNTKEEIGCENISYLVNDYKLDNENYYHVSVGTNTPEKFTAIDHYYIAYDFSKIIKGNPIGRDIIIWERK